MQAQFVLFVHAGTNTKYKMREERNMHKPSYEKMRPLFRKMWKKVHSRNK